MGSIDLRPVADISIADGCVVITHGDSQRIRHRLHS